MYKLANGREIKDKSNIINDIMRTSAEIILARIEFTNIVIGIFSEKRDTEQVEILTAERNEMQQASDIIDKYAGCWA